MLLLLFCSLGVAHAAAPVISTDWPSRLLWLAAPEKLPPQIRPSHTVLHATPIRAMLAVQWPHLREETRLLAQALGLVLPTPGRAASSGAIFWRPARSGEQTLTVGGFRLHYTISGTPAAPADYVSDLAAILADIQGTELTGLGYPPPLPDSDGLYDVYLQNLYNSTSGTGYFGYVQPEGAGGNNPATSQTETGAMSSFMVLENDLAEAVFKSPTLALRRLNLQATVAHEFFHAVQFGLGGFESFSTEDTWLMESTAVWMEETVYPASNVSYTEYLDNFLLAPDLLFFSTDSAQGLGSAKPAPLHEYGSFVFWTFLEDHAPDMRNGLKQLLMDKALNGGALGTQLDTLFANHTSTSKTTLLRQFSLANALLVSPANVPADLAAYTHRDAAVFPVIGSVSGSGLVGVEAALTFDGTIQSWRSDTQGNGRLGPLGADYLRLTVNSPVTVSLAAISAAPEMAATVGTGSGAVLMSPQAATPGSLTFYPTATPVLLRVFNAHASLNGIYQLTLAPASTQNPRCDVDGLAPAGTFPTDAGDVAALLLAVKGADPSGRCAQGLCNFDGVLSNPEPGEGDLSALINAVLIGNTLGVCQ